MEWAAFVYNVGVGLGVVLIGVAVAVLVIASLPLVRETRRLAADTRRLVALVDTELRPTLGHLREAAGEVPARLERIDDLIEQADVTLASLRQTSDLVAGYAGVPGAGVSALAAGLRRARDALAQRRR